MREGLMGRLKGLLFAALAVIALGLPALLPAPAQAATFAIDAGAGASDRASTKAAGDTFVDRSNRVNYTGTITSVEIWFNTQGTGVKVGVFYTSGANLVCRSAESIGTVTAGSKQTFAVSLSCVANDYLGLYWSGGALESGTGTNGAYRITPQADYCSVGASGGTVSNSTYNSFYATGTSIDYSISIASASASDINPFWATLNGDVTLSGYSTVYSGYVWDTTSHSDPGNVYPYNSDYEATGGNYYADDVHTSTFSVPWVPADGAGVGLTPDTTYYFRACVCYEAPTYTWIYGDELSFDTTLNDEGTVLNGYTSYLQVTTENAGSAGASITFHGSVASVGLNTANVDQWGIVWDTVTHANPSGWPSSWADVAPGSSGYAHYEQVDTGWSADFSYDTTVGGLASGTYYFRAVANLGTPGDWDYGPEEEITITGTTTADAMFEVWGSQGGAAKPAWYRALPSLLKLGFIGLFLMMAVIAMRQKPKSPYPETNLPELPE